MKRQTTVTKPAYQRAVKKSVSMPEILFHQGSNRAGALGYSTFSDYLQHLIRTDSFTTQPAPK